MKKLFILLSFIVTLSLAVVTPTAAELICKNSQGEVIDVNPNTSDQGDALGLNTVFGDGGLIQDGKFDAKGAVGLFFGLVVAAGLLYVVWRIIQVAFKIANAKGEQEKRQEAYKSLVEIAIAIALIVLAFPISNTIQSAIGSDTTPILGTPCSGTLQGTDTKAVGVYVEE